MLCRTLRRKVVALVTTRGSMLPGAFQVRLYIRFAHLFRCETTWHPSTHDREVAWEIKTDRQPVSRASVDFTRYFWSRFLSSAFLLQSLTNVRVMWVTLIYIESTAADQLFLSSPLRTFYNAIRQRPAFSGLATLHANGKFLYTRNATFARA